MFVDQALEEAFHAQPCDQPADRPLPEREPTHIGEMRLVVTNGSEEDALVDLGNGTLEPPIVDRPRPVEVQELHRPDLAACRLGFELDDPLGFGALLDPAAGSGHDLKAEFTRGIDPDRLRLERISLLPTLTTEVS